MQSNTVCAAEGQNIAGLVVCTLEKLRSSEAYDLFWQNVTDCSEIHVVGEPDLPRPHKMPKRYEDGNAMYEIHNEPETYCLCNIMRQLILPLIALRINFSSLSKLFSLRTSYCKRCIKIKNTRVGLTLSVLSTNMIFSQSFCAFSVVHI